jgi:hypothetical protein
VSAHIGFQVAPQKSYAAQSLAIFWQWICLQWNCLRARMYEKHLAATIHQCIEAIPNYLL